MTIGYGHLVSVLRQMHSDADEKSLDARVRYFQRRGFPSEDAAVGKGWRSEYGPAEIFKLACALELLNAFVPPAQAAATVADSWRDIADTLRIAWLERERREFALPVLLRGVGFAAKGDAAGVLVAITADDLRTWLQGRSSERMMVTFDALRLARALASAIEKTLPQERADRVRVSLDGWAASGE
jgi:hypothetical protein